MKAISCKNLYAAMEMSKTRFIDFIILYDVPTSLASEWEVWRFNIEKESLTARQRVFYSQADLEGRFDAAFITLDDLEHSHERIKRIASESKKNENGVWGHFSYEGSPCYLICTDKYLSDALSLEKILENKDSLFIDIDNFLPCTRHIDQSIQNNLEEYSNTDKIESIARLESKGIDTWLKFIYMILSYSKTDKELFEDLRAAFLEGEELSKKNIANSPITVGDKKISLSYETIRQIKRGFGDYFKL